MLSNDDSIFDSLLKCNDMKCNLFGDLMAKYVVLYDIEDAHSLSLLIWRS